MSRIGKKPIPLPAGVKYTVEGNTVLVEGPKGKVSALIADGISLEKVGNELHVVRDTDKHAAVHGLTRALVFNAVYGVTTGWKRELDIVGIGYRAELKGKGTQKVGQVAADMRSLRKPDPYKNKGVRYSDEKLKKKAGKTGSK